MQGRTVPTLAFCHSEMTAVAKGLVAVDLVQTPVQEWNLEFETASAIGQTIQGKQTKNTS
jgi:hypothetical protein